MRIANSIIDDRTVLEVGKFGVLWNKFERQYFSTQYSRKKLNDRFSTLMRRYAENSISYLSMVTRQRMEDLYLRNFGNGQTDYYVRSKLGVRKGLWDRMIPDDDIEIVKSFIDNFQAQNRENRMKAAVLVCYRIRCNMFHGMKDTNATDVTGLDAQWQLSEAVNRFLESLVS